MSAPIGKSVPVLYTRLGKAHTCELKTIARQQAIARPVELKGWGMTARDITRMMALERRRENTDGVLVDSLRPGGPCGQAKPAIRRGDIIVAVAGEPVADIAALRTLSAGLPERRSDAVGVLVTFERDKRRLLTTVKVGKEDDPNKPARARKPWAGADTQVLTRDLAEALGLKGKTGVRLTQVYPDRAADRAKFRAGDIILEVDGTAVEASEPEDTEVYPAMLRQYRIGAEVELTVWRDGKTMKLTMKLEAPPIAADRMDRHEDEDFEFTARNLSFSDRTRKRLGDDAPGVLIEKVQPAGWASLARVAGDDVLLAVNGAAVTDVAALKTILAEIKKAKPRRITFFIRRGIHTFFREIEPGWDS